MLAKNRLNLSPVAKADNLLKLVDNNIELLFFVLKKLVERVHGLLKKRNAGFLRYRLYGHGNTTGC